MNAGTLMRRLLAGAGAVALGLTGALATTTAVADDAVPANIDFNAKGSITVTKYAQPETAAVTHDGTELTPAPEHDVLSGVEFTVRNVLLDLSLNAGWDAAETLQPYAGGNLAQAADGATFSLVDPVTKTTDANGVATFDNLPIGVYLVEETSIGANPITNKAAPFYVTVPLPHNESGEWLYDVFVYPKNAVTSIEKKVDESAAQALGTTVSWPIRVTVPHLTAGNALTALTVTDELDARLGFDAVTVEPATLEAEDHFTVSQSADTDGIVTVVVDFTDAGRAELEKQQGEDVVVTVHTTVNSIGDGTIRNDAVVNVNDYTATTNEVTSKWGAVRLFKFATVTVDDEPTERPLEGAEFQVFRTPVDAATQMNPISVVVDGTAVTTFTSAADGTLVIPGLLVGETGQSEYWVAETKAPTGYEPLPDAKNPFVVVVKAQSIESTDVVKIENFQTVAVQLPLTGGAGTALFSVAGLTLIAVAAAIVVAGRRRATSQA